MDAWTPRATASSSKPKWPVGAKSSRRPASTPTERHRPGAGEHPAAETLTCSRLQRARQGASVGSTFSACSAQPSGIRRRLVALTIGAGLPRLDRPDLEGQAAGEARIVRGDAGSLLQAAGQDEPVP